MRAEKNVPLCCSRSCSHPADMPSCVPLRNLTATGVLCCLSCIGEAAEWREPSVAAAASASSSASRALRVASTVAIVAALAVATLVFLTGDDSSAVLVTKVASSAATGPVVQAAAAAQTLARAAPAKVGKLPKVVPAGKGTQKMSDNWKINENVPESPTYSDLEREVSELEKEENQHFSERAKSVNAALGSAVVDNNTAGVKSLKWKNAKDKYEQAAYKDIMDEEKERIQDSITEEGAEMFQQYEKKAQSLMGTSELKKLQNSTEIAEKVRSIREKSALIALKSANTALKRVEAAQDMAREEEDKKKQERANAEITAHLQKSVERESGSKQYYKKVSTT